MSCNTNHLALTQAFTNYLNEIQKWILIWASCIFPHYQFSLDIFTANHSWLAFQLLALPIFATANFPYKDFTASKSHQKYSSQVNLHHTYPQQIIPKMLKKSSITFPPSLNPVIHTKTS